MPVTRDTSRRRQVISALVREEGSVQVAPLAKRFGVTMQTIRKDLQFLADRGIAERSYGGAIASDAVNLTRELPAEDKRAINAAEKQRIGALAATLVRPGESIILDSGTTTQEIARNLPDDESITVLTNDLDIMTILAARQHITAVMLGGALLRRNRSLYGAQAVAAFDDLHVDKLFLGVDGMDVERGITTHFEPEAILNRKMVAAASTVIAVTDQTKFGRVCLHRIVQLDEIHALVTDGAVPEDIELAAQRARIAIHNS